MREGVGVRSVRDGRAQLADGTEVEARVIVGRGRAAIGRGPGRRASPAGRRSAIARR